MAGSVNLQENGQICECYSIWSVEYTVEYLKKQKNFIKLRIGRCVCVPVSGIQVKTLFVILLIGWIQYEQIANQIVISPSLSFPSSLSCSNIQRHWGLFYFPLCSSLFFWMCVCFLFIPFCFRIFQIELNFPWIIVCKTKIQSKSIKILYNIHSIFWIWKQKKKE